MIGSLIPWIILLIILIRIIKWIWHHIHWKPFLWDTNDGKHWAVVTGSTDGIGYEFAKQLAMKGYNIMMLSRNEEKLQAKRESILEQIGSNHHDNIQIKTLAVDFTHTDIYDEKIRPFIQPHLTDIFILVNNVGVGTIDSENYFQQDPKQHQDSINVNVIGTTRMTDLILPTMIQNRRGLVLNISSMISLIECPGYTMYGSTKSFISYYSRSLYMECQPHNVLVFALTPSLILTKLTNRFKTNLMIPKAEDFVQGALQTVNWSESYSIGYTPHKLKIWFLAMVELLFGWNIKTKMVWKLTKTFSTHSNLNLTPSNIYSIIRKMLSDKND